MTPFPVRRGLGWATLLAAVLAACGTQPQTRGEFVLTITGLPAGIPADVAITGPGGFTGSATSTTTLTQLEPGDYTITAATVRGDEAIVPFLYAPSDASTVATVLAGNTSSVTIDHAVLAGSGRLWLGTSSTVSAFERTQLAVTGTPTPAVTVAAGAGTEGVAFEADGDLWVADPGGFLRRYARADLVAGGAVSPATWIGSDGGATPSLAGATGIAFDPDGNLWVATGVSRRLERFASAQLAVGGNPTPDVVLDESDLQLLALVSDIAFAPDGTLWAASRSSGRIVAYRPEQRLASGAPTPAVTITLADVLPYGLAFDTNGDLWVSGSSAVVRLASAQLLSSGAPTPAATIETDAFTDSALAGMAFDHDGALWVATTGGDTLHRFDDPLALVGSVSPTAAAVIQAPTFAGGFPTFWPLVPGLPLRAP